MENRFECSVSLVSALKTEDFDQELSAAKNLFKREKFSEVIEKLDRISTQSFSDVLRLELIALARHNSSEKKKLNIVV